MGGACGPLPGPLKDSQGLAGQSPARPAPGPPAGRKPTLAERLAAMEQRHAQPAPEPDPADPSEPLTTEEVAARMEATWARRFAHAPDGKYVDTRTGVIYDTLPVMHSKDGLDT